MHDEAAEEEPTESDKGFSHSPTAVRASLRAAVTGFGMLQFLVHLRVPQNQSLSCQNRASKRLEVKYFTEPNACKMECGIMGYMQHNTQTA